MSAETETAMTPDISIIIPIYNAVKYLKTCLGCVTTQTYRNIEIICVDDGSTDETPTLLDEHARNDSRIRVIRKTNGGVASARNAGLDAARAEHILFLDQDDTVRETLCAKTLEAARQSQADIVWFFSDSFHSVNRFEKLVGKRNIEDLGVSEQLQDCYIWTKLWKADFLRRHGIRFPVNSVTSEDVYFIWQALVNEPKIVSVKERLYRYSYNPSSQSRSHDSGYFRGIVRTYDDLQKILEKAGKFDGKWKECFLYVKLKAIASHFPDVEKKHQPELLEEIRRSYGESERKFLRSARLPWHVKCFYRSLDGSLIGSFGYKMKHTLKSVERLFRYPTRGLRWLARRLFSNTSAPR